MRKPSPQPTTFLIAGIFLFLLLGYYPLAAQVTVTSPPGSITFQRQYNVATSSENMLGISQTSDSGFVAIGQILDNPSLTFDVYVQRTDKYGNVLWTKTLGAPGFVFERGEEIYQTSDGGYIGTGSTSGNSGNTYLFKLNSSGNLTWLHSFGDFFGVASTESDGLVVQTSDGGYLVAASTDSIGSVDYRLLSLVKVDPSGTLQWEKHYDSFLDSTFQSPSKLTATLDGNYVISGVTQKNGQEKDLFLFKINPNGDTLWTRNYDIGIGEDGPRVQPTADGGYILGGNLLNVSNSDSGSYLLKVDSIGNAQWAKSYVNTSLQSAAFFVDAVSDGGYVFGGYSGLPASFNWNYFLVKTNSIGDTLWTRRYGVNPNVPSVAWEGFETNDLGFVLGGSSSNGSTSDFYIVKTDSLGHSGCLELPHPLTAAPMSTVSWKTPYHIYSTNISFSPASSSGTRVPTVVVNCCHVPLRITGNDTVCIGSNVTLTVSGAYSYLWSTGATTTSITVTANTDTTISVSGFSGPGISCDVLSFHIAAVTLSPAITGNTTICNGSATTLLASGGNTYLWSTGATTSSISVSPSSNTTYSVSVTVGSCTAIDSIAVTVNPTPNGFINGLDTICSGQSATLIAGSGGTYLWNNNATSSSISVSPSSTTNYYVIVSNGLCTDTAYQTVAVNPTPTITITGNNSICAGDNTTLTASGGNSYTWNTGPTTNSITVSPAANTTYSVIGTNTNGCSDTASVNVIVNAIPVGIINGTTTICSGSATTLLASGGNTFAWSTGATTASVNVTPSSTTTYSVIVSNAGCSDTAYSTVTVLPLPTAGVSANDSILIGGSTSISASGGGSYSWSPSAGLSCTNCQNPIASPTQTTTYCVTVTDTSGCSATACLTVFVNTDCGEIFVPNAFSPNGDGQNDFLFVYGTRCIQNLTFTIYDRWGEKVFETTDQLQYWDGTYHGQTMNSAVYVYNLTGATFSGDVISKKGNITLVR